MGFLLLTSAKAPSQFATVYLMEHFHRCLKSICEVLLKGVPYLSPMCILVAFPVQIPATAWPCNQPDQSAELAEWELYQKKKVNFFSQISLLLNRYCQSKGWV